MSDDSGLHERFARQIAFIAESFREFNIDVLVFGKCFF